MPENFSNFYGSSIESVDFFCLKKQFKIWFNFAVQVNGASQSQISRNQTHRDQIYQAGCKGCTGGLAW